jgi:hypothetical protein
VERAVGGAPLALDRSTLALRGDERFRVLHLTCHYDGRKAYSRICSSRVHLQILVFGAVVHRNVAGNQPKQSLNLEFLL